MNVLEIIWSKYWSQRLLMKFRRNYVINIANEIKDIYHSFSITKLRKPKENFSKIKILYKLNIYP